MLLFYVDDADRDALLQLEGYRHDLAIVAGHGQREFATKGGSGGKW